MFRIRFFTPAVVDEHGQPQAGGELAIGRETLRFQVDLRYWSMAAYEAQWRAAIARLAHGARSTALVTAYRGPQDEPHLLWALWREDPYVYLQELSILASELDAPFDPMAPYAQVGTRIPASEQGLPIAEYRIELMPFLAAHFVPAFPWR
ncbi:MAG TPA: hypothetical protein VFS33_01920 [Gemmatimonadales bacterium]|nr:hypothetical protein [Gemmatimonadales bacterium]